MPPRLRSSAKSAWWLALLQCGAAINLTGSLNRTRREMNEVLSLRQVLPTKSIRLSYRPAIQIQQPTGGFPVDFFRSGEMNELNCGAFSYESINWK